MTEAQPLDHTLLQWRSRGVDRIRSERLADHGAGRTLALGQRDQRRNPGGDIVRVRGAGGREHPDESRKHFAGDFTGRTISRRARCIGGLLDAGIHVGRVSAGLHRHDLDAELRQLVAETVGQRLDCEFRCAVCRRMGT
jgi:hypothetical protein